MSNPAVEKSRLKLATKWANLLGPILALLGIFFFFYVLIGPTFSSFFNLQSILMESTVTCMAALGATYIIIAGGIDLSVGSSVALATMVIATLLRMTYVVPGQAEPALYLTAHPVAWPLLSAGVGVLVGLLCGLFNGVVITGLRLAPFIVTLGSMMIFRGLTEAISVVAINPAENWLWKLMARPDLPEWAVKSGFKPVLQWLFIAPALWITLICAVIVALLLKYFRFGRYTIAIGSNEQTARLCGIPVNRTKILLYVLGGVFAGLAGVMQYARLKQGSPAATIGLELDVIAACVIGGASLNGGKGSIMGTLVGALIMNVIANGSTQIPLPVPFPESMPHWLHWVWLPHWLTLGFTPGTGLPSPFQKIVTGGIIIVAVALDNLRQRKSRT